MDRVSDGELSWQRGHCTAMLKSAQPDQRETWRNLVAIIDELRERRAAEREQLARLTAAVDDGMAAYHNSD